MKTTKLLLFFALLAIPLINSCKKEDYLTNAEQIGNELNNVIDTYNVQYVSVQKYYSSSSSYDLYSSQTFKIEGSFIKVGTQSFSLENLSKYYIDKYYINTNVYVCLYLNFN